MGLKKSLFRNQKSSHITPYFALFLFLLAIYLLTYTPRINSSDGLAMFSTAESLVRRGALDIEQIRWMDLQQGTYGLDGLLYSRKGIGLPLGLLPLTWLGLVLPWVGPLGLSLLFNPIVTALTAVLLLAYLRQLGFTSRTGLFVALLFGLATLAWAYAKSLFSDPFSGLLLLAAAYILLKFRHALPPSDPATRRPGRHPATLLYPLLAGLFLGWNVATRYAEALFLPLFGLLLLYYLFTTKPAHTSEKQQSQTSPPSSSTTNSQVTTHNPQSTIRRSQFTFHHSPFTILSLAAFFLPLLLLGLGLIAFNLSRYGDPFNTGYLPNETFSALLWQGLAGQLLSPGRGLLLYSPIFLLSFVGLPPLFRRHRAEALLALSVILIHLFLYGKWFMWHGGFAWGPRFMIPTLPFWALFLAPVVGRSAGHAPRLVILRFLLIFLALLSLIPQLLTVTIDFTPFQGWLLDTGLPLFDPQTFFDPQFSPLLHAWSLIHLDSLDLAWAWEGRFTWWLLAVLLLNITIAGYYLYRVSLFATMLPCYLATSSLATLFTILLLLVHTHSLPSLPLQQAVATLNQAVRPTDAIIFNQPDLAMSFAERYRGRAPVLGLNHGGEPLPAALEQRLAQTLDAHEQIWWLPNWLPPQESTIEQALLATGFRARHEDFDEQRLDLFAMPSDLTRHRRPVNLTFGGLITLADVAFPPTSPSSAALPLELRWQAQAPIDVDYFVFIHLLDTQGNILAQADGQPVLWLRPTSTWAVGETIVDRHGLWLPPDIPPGSYSLLLGLYQPADGQRLPTATGQESLAFEILIQ